MKYIENIVIGQPLSSPEEMFAYNLQDWNRIESEKTYYTTDRWLPKILVDLGIYPSFSEIRRNKPELVVSLNDIDFMELKVRKKQKVWILIGE